jgi:hypothetical protein
MARVRRSSPEARARIADRYEETEGFSRTRTGGDREALPRRGFRDRLHLMPVKRDRLAVDAKDTRHKRVKRSTSNQRLDRDTPLIVRVDRDQRLRPKAPPRVNRVDLLADILGANLRERAGKARVIRNERAIQIKHIHVIAPQCGN